MRSLALAAFASASGAWVLASGPGDSAASDRDLRAPAQLQQDTLFRHDDHQALDCVRCHSSGVEHGRLLVNDLEDCRSCHHTLPVAADCTGCHEDVMDSNRLLSVLQTLAFTPTESATRPLPFQHDLHGSIDCASCHGSPPLDETEVECASCHVDHHGAVADCTSCHVEAPADAHPLTVHAGCTGAACHSDQMSAGAFQGRSLCLACHQDQTEHREGEDCATCHVMPPLSLPAQVGLATPGGRQ